MLQKRYQCTGQGNPYSITRAELLWWNFKTCEMLNFVNLLPYFGLGMLVSKRWVATFVQITRI